MDPQRAVAGDALGYPRGFILTGANVSDFDQCLPLLRANLRPGAYVLMDKGYDSDAIRAYVSPHGVIAPTLPPDAQVTHK